MCADESPETDSLMEEIKINFNATIPPIDLCTSVLTTVYCFLLDECVVYVVLQCVYVLVFLCSRAVVNFINI